MQSKPRWELYLPTPPLGDVALLLILSLYIHIRIVHLVFPVLWSWSLVLFSFLVSNFFLFGLEVWLGRGTKGKHIKLILCKCSFCRHAVAVLSSNIVIDMQKLLTDSYADLRAKAGLSFLFMQYIIPNDFVQFNTFHTVHCSLIFPYKQAIFWK